MRGRVCVVRSGHLGDVVLSEPVAAALVEEGWEVHLCTAFTDVGACLDSYSVVRPFRDYLEGTLTGYERIHLLRYELLPRSHHLDAYAVDAGVTLRRRVPRLRSTFTSPSEESYGVMCPDTSLWMREMRSWPRDRFEDLRVTLYRSTDIPWIMLEQRHSFHEMMSLIQHAACVVTNDSGPAHIAQAMGRPTVVLFGPTNPEYLLVADNVVGVIGPEPCRGCRHVTWNREMACAEPLCIKSISVEKVAESVRCALGASATDRGAARS